MLQCISFQRKVDQASLTDEKLRQFIDHFDQHRLRAADFESPDLLSAACESLTDKLARSAGKQGGEISTPKAVSRMMVRLAKPEEGMRVYDPCSGSGGMLIASAEYVAETGGNPQSLGLYGQEYNRGVWAMSKMDMILRGLGHADLRNDDTLAAPLHIEGGELMHFDRVLANPPYSQNYRAEGIAFEKRFKYGFCSSSGRKADLMFVQHMLAVLNAGGIASTVLPLGVLVRGGQEREIRKGIINDDLLEAVIGLAPNLFHGTGIATCILVMRAQGSKPKQRKGKVLFINADRECLKGRTQNYLEPKHIEKIVRAYERFENVPGFAAVVSGATLEGGDFDLSIPLATASLPTNLLELERNDQTSRLSRLAEIRQGNAKVGAREVTVPSGIRIVTGSHVLGASGLYLDLDEIHDEADDDRPAWALQALDILVPQLLTKETLAVAMVPSDPGTAVASTALLHIRLKDPTPELAEHVATFLSSAVASAWLCAHASSLGGVKRISRTILERLPIPRPNPTLTRLGRVLQAAVEQLRARADSYEKTRRGLFGLETSVEQLTVAQYPVAQAAHVIHFIESIDSLSSLVRNTFPLPLALGWRMVEVVLSPHERYDAILRLAENATVYLAGMLLADLRAHPAPCEGTIGRFWQDTDRSKGLVWGAWTGLLRNAPSLNSTSLEEDSCFPELRRIVGNATHPFWRALEELQVHRNEKFHHEAPRSTEAVRRHVDDAKAQLKELFERILFVTQYPLAQIMDRRHEELRKRRILTVAELVGDHELVVPRQVEVAGDHSRGLHFIDNRGLYRLVEPWLVYEDCLTCGHREVYAPNKAGDPKGPYKSLTTHHKHNIEPQRWADLRRFLDEVTTPR